MIDIWGIFNNFTFFLIVNAITLIIGFLGRRTHHNEPFWEVFTGSLGVTVFIYWGVMLILLIYKGITSIVDLFKDIFIGVLLFTPLIAIYCLPGVLIGSIIGEFLPKQISFVLPSSKSSQDPGVILQQYCKKVNEAWQSNGIDDEILPKETERVFIAYINGLQKNDDSIKFLKRLHSPPCLKWMDDIQAAALNKVKEFGLNKLL